MIYIAGHTGLVGSAILRKLKFLGCRNIITRTHQEMDLMDRVKVNSFFAEEKPEYVFFLQQQGLVASMLIIHIQLNLFMKIL